MRYFILKAGKSITAGCLAGLFCFGIIYLIGVLTVIVARGEFFLNYLDWPESLRFTVGILTSIFFCLGFYVYWDEYDNVQR